MLCLNAFFLFAVKPEIKMETNYEFKRAMIINCTLKTREINPKEVSYMWFPCDSLDTCDKDPLTKSSSLHLDNQPNNKAKYICKATNDAGSDTETITVLNLSAGMLSINVFANHEVILNNELLSNVCEFTIIIEARSI